MTAINKRLTLLIVSFALLLAACAPVQPETGATPLASPTPGQGLTVSSGPTATLSSLERYFVPAYYSPFYGQVVEDSKSENGVLIYASVSAEVMNPAIDMFQSHYPWVNVIVLELGQQELFERYRAESAAGVRTADIVITDNAANWQSLIEDGQVLPYRSPEDFNLPNWAKEDLGIYVVAIDPLVIAYNKNLVENPPASMAEMASLANSFSDELIFRLAAYDISLSPAGFSAHWFWTKNRGEAGWEILKLIGDSTPLLLGNEDEMLAAVGSGQAYLGYFVSGQAVISALDEYPDLAWSYIGDGQPIVFQKMAITQANDSLNSAKLFFDFLLSQEGQFTIASGGLMPYRADVSRISPLHLEKIADVVGQESLIFMSFDSQLSNQVLTAGFQQRWEAALRKPLVPGSDATPDVETEP